MSRSQFQIEAAIPVADLLLDTFNPRIRHGADQDDCIARLLRDRTNFINLCKDIAAKGLTPEHILISKNADGEWVVRDGNRRVAALKLLNNPTQVQSDSALFNTLNRAIAASTAIPTHVDCLACDDETAILDYLERKHTGENQGVGQRTWSALLKSLFSLQAHSRDDYKRAAQLLIWVEERGLTVDDNFYISTLQRGLNADTLALIGFTVQDDELVTTLPEHQAYALAARVVQAVANEEVNVKRGDEPGSIFTPEAQLAFFTAVRNELGPSLADTSTPTTYDSSNASASPSSQPADTGGVGGAPSDPGSPTVNDQGSQANSYAGTGGTRKPSSPNTAPRDRPCLFGPRKNSSPGISIPADETKISSIIVELRKLNPHDTPLATTMLFRALIELSNDRYREKNDLKAKGQTPLHKSLMHSADHMKTVGLLSGENHNIVQRYTREEQTILHIRTIQEYVHQPGAHPNGQTLNTMWDELSCFVRACWQ